MHAHEGKTLSRSMIDLGVFKIQGPHDHSNPRCQALKVSLLTIEQAPDFHVFLHEQLRGAKF